ncbi:MAG: hypothetical protein ACK56I_33590, partial [bacterium]
DRHRRPEPEGGAAVDPHSSRPERAGAGAARYAGSDQRVSAIGVGGAIEPGSGKPRRCDARRIGAGRRAA